MIEAIHGSIRAVHPCAAFVQDRFLSIAFVEYSYKQLGEILYPKRWIQTTLQNRQDAKDLRTLGLEA